MGHVDHGKTTLVEKLLDHNKSPQALVHNEVGGISQNIALYKLPYGILVDTPGHEVFSSLREVLMKISDIIILVIAGDSGIQSETIDIIKKAPENANFIVAINKIDKGDKNVESIINRLCSYGIVVDEKGGETLTVKISAKNGTGLTELIDTINLQWELMESVQTNRSMYAIGYIMDCYLKQGLGYITSIIIEAGKLNQSDDIIVNGKVFRVKLIRENGQNIKSCSVDQVVEIVGITEPIFPGTRFCAIHDTSIVDQLLNESIHGTMNIDGNNVNESKDLFILQTNSIVKLDTLISLFRPKGTILDTNVSNIIKDSVVDLAKSSNAKVILWGDYDDKCTRLLKQHNIEYIAHEIIYSILESIEKPKNNEKSKEILGTAKIKKIFNINGKEIAGCGVLDGKISIGDKCIIKRNGEDFALGKISSMKREKDTIKEAVKNTECGLIIHIEEVLNTNYVSFMESDEVIAFKWNEV
jgi:translation initiation factor IF-2